MSHSFFTASKQACIANELRLTRSTQGDVGNRPAIFEDGYTDTAKARAISQ